MQQIEMDLFHLPFNISLLLIQGKISYIVCGQIEIKIVVLFRYFLYE